MHQFSILLFILNIFCNFPINTSLGQCYSNSHKILFCQPNFMNIIQNSTTISSSTCGTKRSTENICSLLSSNNCFNCNNEIGTMSRNISLLFDNHERKHETCWIPGKMSQQRILDVVNVTINFDKLYEVSYITVEFCGALPDSIVFLKSRDYGRTWSPWHFFSSSCQQTFNMKRCSAAKMERKHKFQTLNPVCFALPKANQSIKSDNEVIAFNPMIGRQSNRQDTMAVKQWTSLTNLKITMIVDNHGDNSRQLKTTFGISDIAIGGRAQCFGHAANMRTENGTVVCDCDHNTEGRDCTQCKASHNDQPWMPIRRSAINVQECKKCFCHNHAQECVFDQTLYEKNNRLHGSRCLNCLHNTMGANCESCKTGFYRDMEFPINHTKACQNCKCHIIGANTRTQCDRMTGFCHCKEGVEGPTCNRCKKGYHQTRSSVKPCEIGYNGEEQCELCGRRKIKFKRFCRKEIIIKLSVQSKEIHGHWIRFGGRVETIWRIQHIGKSKVHQMYTNYHIYPIWLEISNSRCNCPKVELDRTYLVLTKIKQKLYLQQPELILDRRSTVIPWNDAWSLRLNKFAEKEKQGKCVPYKNRRIFSYQRLRHRRNRFMNAGKGN